MLHHNLGMSEPRGDRHSFALGRLEEGELVFERVAGVGGLARVVRRQDAVQPPVREPIAGRQERLGEAGAEWCPPVDKADDGGPERDERHAEPHEEEADGLYVEEQRERDAGARDCHVAQVLARVVRKSAAPVVRLAPEAHVKGEPVDLQASCWLELGEGRAEVLVPRALEEAQVQTMPVGQERCGSIHWKMPRKAHALFHVEQVVEPEDAGARGHRHRHPTVPVTRCSIRVRIKL